MRQLQFSVPRVLLGMYPQVRYMEDVPLLSSTSLAGLLTSSLHRRGLDAHAPIARYYERLGEHLSDRRSRAEDASDREATTTTSSSTSTPEAPTIPPAILQEIFRHVQNSLVPCTLLRDWALASFQDPLDFFTFRKRVTHSINTLSCILDTLQTFMDAVFILSYIE